jgi:hypothetical protein
VRFSNDKKKEEMLGNWQSYTDMGKKQTMKAVKAGKSYA